MLVVPALLSLKPSVVEKASPEMAELMQAVVRKLRDSQDVVSKTARKLILEIQKCYPDLFESKILSSLKSEEDRILCRAVVKGDEEDISKALVQPKEGPQKQTTA